MSESNINISREEKIQLIKAHNSKIHKARKLQLGVITAFLIISLFFDFHLLVFAVCVLAFAGINVYISAYMECPICGKPFPGRTKVFIYGPQICSGCGTRLDI